MLKESQYVASIWYLGENISMWGGENGKNTKGQKTELSKPYIILLHLYICDQCKYIDVYTGN